MIENQSLRASLHTFTIMDPAIVATTQAICDFYIGAPFAAETVAGAAAFLASGKSKQLVAHKRLLAAPPIVRPCTVPSHTTRTLIDA